MNDRRHSTALAAALLAGSLLLGACSGGTDAGGGSSSGKASAADQRLLEQVHQERTLARWIADLEHPDENARSLAASVLASIGPDARPAWSALAERARDPDERFDTRATAVRGLGRIGASESVPALLELMDEKNFGPGAAEALREVGRASVPALCARMKAEETPTMLPRMALAGLVEDGEVKASDLAGLWPRLVQGLTAEDQGARLWTMRVLAGLGPEAAPATPAVGEVLKDAPDDQAREAALVVLGAVGEPARKLLDEIEAHVSSDAPAVRLEASLALAKLGRTEPAVAAMMEMLDHEVPAWRLQAAESLGQLGPAAKAARPRLEELAASTDVPGLRQTIEAALERIGE